MTKCARYPRLAAVGALLSLAACAQSPLLAPAPAPTESTPPLSSAVLAAQQPAMRPLRSAPPAADRHALAEPVQMRPLSAALYPQPPQPLPVEPQMRPFAEPPAPESAVVVIPGMRPLPVAETAPVAPVQGRLTAPADWRDLASQVADGVADAAAKGDWPEEQAFFLLTPTVNSHFSRALQNFLLTALQQRGLQISQKPEDAALVAFEVQPLVMNGRLEMIVTTSIDDTRRYWYRQSDVFLINPADARLYESSLVPPPPPNPFPTRLIKLEGK